MGIYGRIFVYGAVLALCPIWPVLRAQNQQELLTRLDEAEKAATLVDAGTQPYYLKIAVQLYDPHGKPTEQGTVEQWWAAPGLEKRAFTFPSCKAVEVRKQGELFRSEGVPLPPNVVESLLREVVHPMPSKAEIDASVPAIQTLKFGSVALDCIQIGSAIPGLRSIPVGLFPTYCFDPGKTSLRLTYQFGTDVLIRNSVGMFQGKSVPIDVAIRSDNVMTATGHITALMSKAISEDEISTAGLRSISSEIESLPPEQLKGMALSQPAPVYPEEAKRNHITGTVVLRAQIGTDGRLEDLKVASSPDPDLAVAALGAVRKWRYTPYTVNGEPVQVVTKIRVNFEMR